MDWITRHEVAMEEQTIFVVPSAETEEALGRSTARVTHSYTSSVRWTRENDQLIGLESMFNQSYRKSHRMLDVIR